MFLSPPSRRFLRELSADRNSVRGGLEFGSFMASLTVARGGSLIAMQLKNGPMAPVGSVCCIVALIPLVACVTVFRGIPN